MVTLGGVLPIVWFLYRKPGLTGMTTLDVPGGKCNATREKAASSDTLLPVASAIRNGVL